MNINRKIRRKGKRVIDLRWAAALAFAATAFSACGSDPSEGQAVANEAAANAPEQRAHASDRHLQTLADQVDQRVLYEHIDHEADARADAEQRAALIQRANSSDRHLQTLADQVSQRVLYAHIDHEADARAEAAAGRDRELQSQGSDQHLENLADEVGSDDTAS